MEIPQTGDPILLAHRESMLDVIHPLKALLTGSNLLARGKAMGDASKSDLVRACGYVSTKKDGNQRLNFTSFDEVLLGPRD